MWSRLSFLDQIPWKIAFLLRWPPYPLLEASVIDVFKEGIVRPTSERITKLLLGIENILKMESQATARDFLHLLVIKASCIELIPNARLFMQPIQLHLLPFLIHLCEVDSLFWTRYLEKSLFLLRWPPYPLLEASVVRVIDVCQKRKVKLQQEIFFIY
jgi:hypothetical protein